MLWAWERPERLDWIDPASTGVAFLAETIRWRPEGFRVQQRLQPLTVPPRTYLMAVVRLETEKRTASTRLIATSELIAAIAGVVRPGIDALQIDFDARRSERPAYRDLLVRLRSELPPSTRLSMTALASWAIGDPWLDALPVDEAVPMLFRMGADDRVVRRLLERGGDFGPVVAQRSLGIAIDEPLSAGPRGRRIYLFNPRSWSPARALEEVRRWHVRDDEPCPSSS